MARLRNMLVSLWRLAAISLPPLAMCVVCAMMFFEAHDDYLKGDMFGATVAGGLSLFLYIIIRDLYVGRSQ